MNEQSTELVTQIWIESRVRLKNFIAQKINNPLDVEDVLQDVFCKIQQNILKLKDPEKLYPWIFQTTRNAIIDFYRERKSQSEFSDEILSDLVFEQTEKDVEEEVLRWLEPMIGELPDKYRDALILTDIKGLTQKELSEKLHISLSGAKSRVRRGRDHLKEILLGCCHLEFNRDGQIIEYRQKTKDCAVCSH